MTPSDLIKPLVWEEFSAWTHRVGPYYVREKSGRWLTHIRFYETGRLIAETDGLEAAQAAAQAHYTARILSALDPDAIARIRADALREASEVVLSVTGWAGASFSDRIEVVGLSFHGGEGCCGHCRRHWRHSRESANICRPLCRWQADLDQIVG